MIKEWSEYTAGEKIFIKALELACRPDTHIRIHNEVITILLKFEDDPNQLDLETICRLETLLDTELLVIPTKQQWRKIKLERLNDICDEK